MSNEQQKSLILSSNSVMPSTSKAVENNSNQHMESRKRNNCSPCPSSSQMSSSQSKKLRASIPPIGNLCLPQEVDLSNECRAKYERWAKKQKMYWSSARQTSSLYKERKSELEPHQISENSSAELSEMNNELRAVEQKTFYFKEDTAPKISSTSEDSHVVDTERVIDTSEPELLEKNLRSCDDALIRGVLESFLPINPDSKTIYAYSILRS